MKLPFFPGVGNITNKTNTPESINCPLRGSGVSGGGSCRRVCSADTASEACSRVCRSAEDNYIAELEGGALRGCHALRTLRLARNLLRHVPTLALAPLRHLQTLYVLQLRRVTAL